MSLILSMWCQEYVIPFPPLNWFSHYSICSQSPSCIKYKCVSFHFYTCHYFQSADLPLIPIQFKKSDYRIWLLSDHCGVATLYSALTTFTYDIHVLHWLNCIPNVKTNWQNLHFYFPRWINISSVSSSLDIY